jgi:uncharacterized protein
MLLDIHHLKDGIQNEVEHHYKASDLDLEFVDFHYLKEIELNGFVEKIENTITFRGMLTSEVEQTCARCLESTLSPLAAPFDLIFEVGAQETIDVTDDIRDILILCHPDRYLCRSDCRGICLSCGQNLNHKSCSCQSKPK